MLRGLERHSQERSLNAAKVSRGELIHSWLDSQLISFPFSISKLLFSTSSVTGHDHAKRSRTTIPAPRNYPPILARKVDQFNFYYAAARRGNTYAFSLAQITLCNGTSTALRGEREGQVDFQGFSLRRV